MKVLEIDGSHGEGGGQLARMAVALAAISGQAIHLNNIRARRPKPGLMAQHLAALRAVATLCGGVLEGDSLGTASITFQPGAIQGGTYDFEVGTAGSIALVLQAALPVALRAPGPSRLTVHGGSDVRMAPPVDYLRWVFLPWLERMGAQIRLESVRHGYFPKGGGEVSVSLAPALHLKPLQAESPGAMKAIDGLAHVARLPLHIPERMAASARSLLADLAPVHIETRVLDAAESFGTGGAMVLVAHAAHGHLGAAVVAQRGITAERLGVEAGSALRAEITSGAGLDLHAADQLLIYAALAEGVSCFTAREVSLHARTVMWLIEQFLPVRFEVADLGPRQRLTVLPA